MNIWIIIIAVMMASFIIQQTLKSKFARYSKVSSPDRLSGADIAKLMLSQNGIYDVEVRCINGMLTDHYDPLKKVINLSRDVYEGRNIAACAVAAHETGHAIQHANGYLPLKLRSAIVPMVSFANNTVQWILLLGVLLINITPTLLYIGIGLFAFTTVFSLITLPVEINASTRAVAWLTDSRVVNEETRPMAADALRWAAYTYVIAAIGSLATLFYYIALANNRD